MTQEESIEKTRRSLLIYAERHNISKACRVFKVSRTTYYKIRKQFERTGDLKWVKRRKPRMPNETKLSYKKLLLKFVKAEPMRGSSYYAYKFEEYGIKMSNQTVWNNLNRLGLNNKYKRLLYIEKLNKGKRGFTEVEIKRLNRCFKKIPTGEYPGNIVALDTYYVGNIKGVGRIYQISGIDICSRYGLCRLYSEKTADSVADFLEHNLIPAFSINKISIDTILTDNGTEYVNSKIKYICEDYSILHKKIPLGKPSYNGYCERYQRTIKEEFYAVTFRKKFYERLEELEDDLRKYIAYYNFKRPHFGLSKRGEKPINVFLGEKAFLQERFNKLLT